jgi:hypothetical protein
MIGRMVWWESAAAPTRDEQALKFAQTWCRSKPRLLNFDELLGSFGRRSRLDWFGFTRLVGPSVGAAAWVRSDSPATSGSFRFARHVGFVGCTRHVAFVRSTQALGSECIRQVGFVRLVQLFGFVRLGGDSILRPLRRGGSTLDGRWEFYPISASLTTSIPTTAISTRSGSGRRSDLDAQALPCHDEGGNDRLQRGAPVRSRTHGDGAAQGQRGAGA